MIPGQYLLETEPIEINASRSTVRRSGGEPRDRPIQVGSHCHFFRSRNRALAFDRGKAYGMRQNVAAGTAVRFEPGDEKDVVLVALGGTREVRGLNALVNGRLDDAHVREQALRAVDGFCR